MILSFTAINRQTELRDFFCNLEKLEEGLDLLSTVAAQGDTIIKVNILEEGNWTKLPPEAFDGQMCADSIRQLEREWQTILKKPIRSGSEATNWRIDFTRKQLRAYETRIIHFAKMISNVECLRQYAETSVRREPFRTQTIARYDTMLERYYQCVHQMELEKLKTQKKLRKLEYHLN